MTASISPVDWLAKECAAYELEPIAVYRTGSSKQWPLTANTESELIDKLERSGHFLPLPTEPAALANVLEVSIVDFLLNKVAKLSEAEAQRGSERGYPDIELSGPVFGDEFYAVDIKVARRANSKKQTKSRITLFTGNTYFRYPTLKWPGTFRPFNDYAKHIDIIAIYTLNKESLSRIDDLEIIVTESWKIGSKKRSSTTREYIGAVMSIDDLKMGNGKFQTETQFYDYWRKFPFKIGRAVQQQLDKILKTK
ncbi:type II restriction endonuclease [Nisaea sp.]|uniref:type II restriction endonuclease n=1 Tax=Nisaea sp. TaxID=2024842 RepID=UPI003266A9A7